jgi:hypothetical protein
MSNVNNYAMSNKLELFKKKMIETQTKKIDEAQKKIEDPLHQWGEGQFPIAEQQLKNYKDWLQFYQDIYDEGCKLCLQHETLVNTMSKVYDRWYSDISNEGKQETEIMSSQADILCELMGELYKELAPLNLPNMKPPKGLNL